MRPLNGMHSAQCASLFGALQSTSYARYSKTVLDLTQTEYLRRHFHHKTQYRSSPLALRTDLRLRQLRVRLIRRELLS